MVLRTDITDEDHTDDHADQHNEVNQAVLDLQAGDATVVDVTGTFDLLDANDAGKILRYTNASLVTVALGVGLAVGTRVQLLSWGAAGLEVVDDGGAVVHEQGSIAQYESLSCVVVATDTWSVIGPLT